MKAAVWLLPLCACVQDVSVFESIDGGATGMDGSAPDAAPEDAGPQDAGIGNLLFGRRLAAGLDHACGIKNDGTLRCWGLNQAGQIGDSTTATATAPVELFGAWYEVAAGGNFTCGIQQDRSLWCWGDNQFGALGQGDTMDRLRPTRVTLPGSADEVSLGRYHTCARSGGNLYCWGQNAEGQGGQEDNVNNPLELLTPTLVPGTWTHIAAADGHNCAIDDGQQLFCWGRNTQGQLGLQQTPQLRTPTRVTEDRWLHTAVTQAHSCAIDESRQVFCWGDGGFGRTGHGDDLDRNTPVPLAINGDGYTRLANGWFSTCGLRTDTTVWCWGWNSRGQLALGDTDERRSPVQVPNVIAQDIAVGRFFMCVMTSVGDVACAGLNEDGQLGVPGVEDRTPNLTFQSGW